MKNKTITLAEAYKLSDMPGPMLPLIAFTGVYVASELVHERTHRRVAKMARFDPDVETQMTAAVLAHAYNVLPDAATFINEHVPLAMKRVSELLDAGKIDAAKAILSLLEINRSSVMGKINAVDTGKPE